MYLLLNPRLSFVSGGLFAAVISLYAGAALATYALPESRLLQNVMILCFVPTVATLLTMLVMQLLEAPASVARALQTLTFTFVILVAMAGGKYQGYAIPVEALMLGALAQGLALTVLSRTIWRNS